MEANHLKAVEELEALYERKLAFENEKYLQLEQSLLEDRSTSTKKVKSLENKHEDTVEKLQGEFKDSFNKA